MRRRSSTSWKASVVPLGYARGMWKRWYHVAVDTSDGKRYLIAIEATSALEARRLVAADWGDESIREVRSSSR